MGLIIALALEVGTTVCTNCSEMDPSPTLLTFVILSMGLCNDPPGAWPRRRESSVSDEPDLTGQRELEHSLGLMLCT